MSPHAVVERVGHDIFIPKVLQVDIGQSRKGTEKEQIADERPFEVHLWGIDEQPEFFFSEEALFCFFFWYTAVRERITYQPTVLHCFMQQHADRTRINPDRVVMQVFSASRQVSKSVTNVGRISFRAISLT